MNKEIKPETPGKERSADDHWRFRTYSKKQLAILARHIPCRTEDLMDRYDDGLLLGMAYGTHLEVRLRVQFRWPPEKINSVLEHLCRIT